MNHVKSHGETYLNVTEALLLDMSSANEVQWFPPSVARKTYKKVVSRVDAEGLGFLTKTLPRYSKALDKALSGSRRLSVQGFKTLPGTNLPRFLGEFTSRVFTNDGWIKPDPCIVSVKCLRLITSLWYKLELTYETEQEANVLNSFTATEDELPAPHPEYAYGSTEVYAAGALAPKPANCSVGAACSGVPQQRDNSSTELSCVDEPDINTVDELERCIGYQGSASPASGGCVGEQLRRFEYLRELPTGHCRCSGAHAGRAIDRGDSREELSSRYCPNCRHWQTDRRPHQEFVGPGSQGNEDPREAYGTGCETESAESSQGVATCAQRACNSAAPYGAVVNKLGEIEGLTFDLRHDTLMERVSQLLERLLSNWDYRDIIPQHGPGAVSGGETQAEKRALRRFIPQLDRVYPYDQYMYWSPSHLCDELQHFQRLEVVEEPTARVVLVPKDSRGPRVISCENAENMRIQQGIMRSLVSYIEHNPLTMGCVSFTDQSINGRLAAEGSKPHGPATLDLKDASDRLSLRFVQEVWPRNLVEVIEAVRSTHTLLPDGRRLHLKKHAPMGSSLCFPVMAVSIWAVGTACLLLKYGKRDPRKMVGRLYVYGDDVITPEIDAIDVMAALEAVGLKVNRDKSFVAGPFKESCGEDWFAGHRVNGIKIRTPRSSRMSAEHYTSWIDYSNQFFLRGCFNASRVIAKDLELIYGSIPRYPGRDPKGLPFPALVHELGQGLDWREPQRKYNKDTQSWLYRVYASEPVKYKAPKVGWCDMLDLAMHGRKPEAWQSARLESVETKYLNLILGADKLTVTGPSDANASHTSKNNTEEEMRSFAIHKRSKLRRVWRGDTGVV